MANPFVAEIRIFPFYFAPKGWAMCNGQLLPISQNTALFSLIGTYYGGDGKSDFALPDLQGSAAMQAGQGQGLSGRQLGEIGGNSQVTLQQSQMPAHTHLMMAVTADATTSDPANAVLAQGAWSFQGTGGAMAMYVTGGQSVNMAPTSLSFAGSGSPHNNMQPYLALNFCIALQGVFPARP